MNDDGRLCVKFIHCGNKSIANPADQEQKNIFFMPMGLFALADTLDKHGVDVEIINLDLEEAEGIEEILDFETLDMVCLDCHWINQGLVVMETAELIKKIKPGIFILLSGFSASLFAEEIVSDHPQVDAIIRGDAEIPIVELVNLLQERKAAGKSLVQGIEPGKPAAVQNLTWRGKDGNVTANEITYVGTAEEMEKLDFAAVDFLRNFDYYRYMSKIWTHISPISKYPKFLLEVARGCQYACTFCGGNCVAQQKMNNRKTTTVRSVDSVVATVKKAASYGYETFYTCMDFEGSDDYYVELFNRIGEENPGLNYSYGCYRLPSKKLLDAISENFKHVMIEISPETVDEELRKKNKDLRLFYTNEQLEEFLDFASEKDNVNVQLCFGYYLVGDTGETILSTIKYILKLLLKYPRLVEIEYPNFSTDPGSLLFFYPEKYGVDINARSFKDYLAHLKDYYIDKKGQPADMIVFKPAYITDEENRIIHRYISLLNYLFSFYRKSVSYILEKTGPDVIMEFIKSADVPAEEDNQFSPDETASRLLQYARRENILVPYLEKLIALECEDLKSNPHVSKPTTQLSLDLKKEKRLMEKPGEKSSKKKTIDCLIIGHNETDFEKYVDDVKEMGVNSGAYRDLELNFLRYNNRPYHAAGMFNYLCKRFRSPGESLEPIAEGESFGNTIAYLGSYLDNRGFTFDYVHSFQAEKDALAEKLKQDNILAIAITTTLYVHPVPVIEIMNFIKKYNRTAAIVVGGPFISTQCRVADPGTLEYLFNSIGADFYVNSSQGEGTLVKLLNALQENTSPANIENIYYKTDGGGYASTPLLKENNKLSQNMVNWDLFSNRVGEYVNLRTTISCPFACAFCGFPEHAGKYQTADIHAIERELNPLKKIPSVKNLHFIDDTMNIPQKRFKEFLRMLIRNSYDFKWQTQVRCQFLDEETVALMKESGCEGVFLGLESGSDQILKNMNKSASVEEYSRAIALLKKYEILTYGSFIIGFPGETAGTVRDTVGLIEQSKIDFYRTQLWYCEPVTPIWKQRGKYGLTGSHFEWSHATMDSKEATGLIREIFISIETSVWLPQQGFDFLSLFHLLNRGISLPRVKEFLRSFNMGIKEKLSNPSAPEAGTEIVDRMKSALFPGAVVEKGETSPGKSGRIHSDRLAVAASRKVKERAYWLKKLSGELPKSVFPSDYRNGTGEPRFESAAFKIEGDLYADLMKISNNSDHTLHMVLIAGLVTLLAKYTGSDDIVIGTPIYRQETDKQLINSVLVLRNRIEKEMTVKQLLIRVKETLVEATSNYAYPIEILAEELNMPFTGNNFPFFDIAILLESIHNREYLGNRKPGITLSFAGTVKQIDGRLEYNARLYGKDGIERRIRHYTFLLRELLSNPARRLCDVDMLPGDEKEQILYAFNNTQKKYPEHLGDKTVVELFEQQVEKTPDKIALLFENRRLSYRRLNERANRWAALLREKGIRADSLVALLLEPSIERTVVILGVLKAGGACLPIDPQFPEKRILSILGDSEVSLLLTAEDVVRPLSFTALENISAAESQPYVSAPRPQIKDFDSMPIIDRSLVDYEKFMQHIGIARAKHTACIQATRGCPYRCLYCHKIWPKNHVSRSAENVFREILQCYNAGVRRFTFIDDVFNLHAKNSGELLRKLIANRLDVQLSFPNGLRGDILTKDFIDLMIEAGTVQICVALESASPRIQKLLHKNLNLDKFMENVQYISRTYPHVVLDMEMMLGFPTETEEEALLTLDFLKQIKWIHFPDLNILKIFPNTDIHKLALEHGVSEEAIERSTNLAYNELPETLPFSKAFTRQYQARLMNEYFFLKERLLDVLPHQMKVADEDELVQIYNSYLPFNMKRFSDIIGFAGIKMEELGGATLLKKEFAAAPGFNEKIKKYFPVGEKASDAFRVLLLDLSVLFLRDSGEFFDMIEEPLGLMSLMTYLNHTFGSRVTGKIAKSRVDFSDFDELKALFSGFKPDLIGIRTLSVEKEFFHKSISMLRKWGFRGPILSGGPYATSDYKFILQDTNVDLLVMGEGEHTFAELVGLVMENGKKLPADNVLEKIPGVAFMKKEDKLRLKVTRREVLLLEEASPRLDGYSPGNPIKINTGSDLLYLISTSGSTGEPKSVMIEHRNLVNLLNSETVKGDIDFSGRVLHFTSIGFDVSFQEIFSTLTGGGTLCVVPTQLKSEMFRLFDFIRENNIDTVFLPPSFLKVIFSEPDFARSFPKSVRHIVAAGEQLIVPPLLKSHLQENRVYLHNHYGPSETHVVTTLVIDPHGDIPETPSIGKPIYNTKILLLDKDDSLLPVGAAGELYISGANVGRGYFKREELTAGRFMNNPFFEGERMYRTGDLARWLSDGNIEFLGRIDSQVKIRGFRVELGEIESCLRTHSGLKEAVVLVREDAKEDKYLCAYYVAGDGGVNAVDPTGLREYLANRVPDYMVPLHFVPLSKIPLTANGKVDRKALPSPGAGFGGEYLAPDGRVEEILVEIWSEVLDIEKNLISVNSDFFIMGGHSLKATILAARIHKELNVNIPLGEMFNVPTIRGQAKYIENETPQVSYAAVEPAGEKDYYALSSAQKRLFTLQRMNPENTNYNLSNLVVLEGEVNPGALNRIFEKLIERHEILRTSFEIVDNEPVQKIHRDVPFSLDYFEAESRDQAEKTLETFIKPFELGTAPLLRAGLIKTDGSRYLLMVDMHHIVTDAKSHDILEQDFMTLSEGGELPELKLQYKDFSEWQAGMKKDGTIKAQEQYWLKVFDGDSPVLNLPVDYSRSPNRGFGGSSVRFKLEKEVEEAIKRMALDNRVTLYQLFLALFNVLLAKVCGQEDIVVGTPVSGRRHADLEKIMGLFVNTLALRNHPGREKRFTDFLQEIKERTLGAFENQDYPFEDLVDRLDVNRDMDRNPLFDVMFSLIEIGTDLEENVEENRGTAPFKLENNTSRFDINLTIAVMEEHFLFDLIYSTSLFKRETIEGYAGAFKKLVSLVLEDPGCRISELELISEEEKQEIVMDSLADLEEE